MLYFIKLFVINSEILLTGYLQRIVVTILGVHKREKCNQDGIFVQFDVHRIMMCAYEACKLERIKILLVAHNPKYSISPPYIGTIYI